MRLFCVQYQLFSRLGVSYRRRMDDEILKTPGLAPPANDSCAPIGHMDGNWLDDDEFEPPMPSAYALCTNEGRCGFLEAYIWRGEDVIWEAVNHIWNSLNPPKALRCTLIGAAAESGGAGKAALINFLRKALREALDDGLIQPTSGYPDIGAFHAASMDYFAASYAHYEKTIVKYASMMNGDAEAHAPAGSVIVGPWK